MIAPFDALDYMIRMDAIVAKPEEQVTDPIERLIRIAYFSGRRDMIEEEIQRQREKNS